MWWMRSKSNGSSKILRLYSKTFTSIQTNRMTKEELLELEYRDNELVNQNYTYEEFLELYEEWKKCSNILSFNSFIRLQLWQN